MALLQIHEPGETPAPHEGAPAIGIDLGTTHSVVALSQNGNPDAIPDAGDNSIIPSVVHYAEQSLVGAEAKAAYARGDGNVVASVKRLMGKSAADIPAIAGSLPFTLDGSHEGMARIQLAERSITPVEVSADILRHLRAMAEVATDSEITKAVITVPAYFDDAARAATKDAAKLAGLEVLRLLNEPTAAALAYGLDQQAKGCVVVYDLGGGTFDVSVLKLNQGVFQVLSTAGDTLLGGDDMDQALAAHALDAWGVSETLNDSTLNQLLAECRVVKELLSDKEAATLNWQSHSLEITRDSFNGLVTPLVKRSIDCAERAMHDAKIEVSEVDAVVLVGGSTRVPLVKQQVENFFGKAPHDAIDPDLVVAMGAAIQAEALTKGADHLLLDVLPLSLGLETMGGITEKIIHRNTPIPVAVAQEFTTYKDGQNAMDIHVLQGEREQVADCRSLARFRLSGIPAMTAGMARIKVEFRVDADGMLTVSAEETTTGNKQEVAVQPSYGLATDEMEAMLRASMENAQTDILARLLIEARVDAERTAMDLESAMADAPHLLKPGEAEMFAAQLDTLRKAVFGHDRERIDYEVQQLNALIAPFAQRRMDAAIQHAVAGKHVDEAL